jgi:hypothetical protein
VNRWELRCSQDLQCDLFQDPPGCYESYDNSTNPIVNSECELRHAGGGFDLMRVDTTSYESFGQIFSGIKCARLTAGASLPMVYDWEKLPTASRGGPTKSDQVRPENLQSGEPQNSSEPNWLVERLTFETI